jgi:hypothetical protein
MASVATAGHSTDLGEAETFPEMGSPRIPRTPWPVYAIAGDREGSRMLATVRLDRALR